MVRIALLGLGLLGAPAFAQEYRDNVVIVLDASGSMNDTMGNGTNKMTAAVDAIDTVLKQLPPTTQVGVLVFSGRNVEEAWLVPLGPRDDKEVSRRLHKVQGRGDTPLGAYMKVAADRLLQEREAEHGYGTYRLLVVTDGEASDHDKVDRFAPDIVGRGIGLDVIGVKMSTAHTLKRMADSYRSADNPEQLVRAVREVLAEVAGTGADAATQAVFADIDGLPDAFAMSLLATLSEPGNHPIGQAPPPPPRPEPEPDPAAPAAPVPPQEGCSTASGGQSWLLAAGALLLLRRRRS